MNNNLFWATAYPILALVLMIMGFVKDHLYFYGAIIIGFVAWYWIVKAWRENNKKKNLSVGKGILKEIGKQPKPTEIPKEQELPQDFGFSWGKRIFGRERTGKDLYEKQRKETFSKIFPVGVTADEWNFYEKQRKELPSLISFPKEHSKATPKIRERKKLTLNDFKSSNHPTPQNLIIKVPDGITREIDGHKVYFDKDGYKIYENWWEVDDEYKVSVDKKGYLVAQKGKSNYKIQFARYLKKDEIEDMAGEMGCSKRDIHVHHKNSIKLDNREVNLEVLYKEEHAKRHGFNNWKEFQIYRKRI